MPFVTYLGVGAALAVASFVIAFSNIPIDRGAPEAPVIPIATLEAIGSTTPFHTQLEALIPGSPEFPHLDALVSATSSLSASAPLITPPAIPRKPEPVAVPTPSPITSAPVTAPAVPETPAPAPETPDARVRRSLIAASVNILCTGNGGAVHGMSASGVIISPKGIIMTVAHAGQYHLLYDYPSAGSVSCIVRTGSPARRTYTAKPVYISEEWIEKNPRTLSTSAPSGSGEHDFAFLAITGSATGAALPSSFPYVPLASTDPKKGETVVIAAYPAQTLTSSQVQSALPMTVVTSTVTDRYSYEATTVDAISLGGSEAAQTGSSGGGVANLDGKIVGLITTSSTEGPYVARNLLAITPGHIRRSFKTDTGKSLDQYLSEPLSTLTTSFERTASTLRAILVRALES